VRNLLVKNYEGSWSERLDQLEPLAELEGVGLLR
jgi:hypothetical protein